MYVDSCDNLCLEISLFKYDFHVTNFPIFNKLFSAGYCRPMLLEYYADFCVPIDTTEALGRWPLKAVCKTICTIVFLQMRLPHKLICLSVYLPLH